MLALGGEGRAGGRGRRGSGTVALDRSRLVLAGGVFAGRGGGWIERRLVADGFGGRSSGRRGWRRIGRDRLGRLAGGQQQREGGWRQGKACEGAEIHRLVPGSG